LQQALLENIVIQNLQICHWLTQYVPHPWNMSLIIVVGRSAVLRVRKVPNSFCRERAKHFGLCSRCVTPQKFWDSTTNQVTTVCVYIRRNLPYNLPC
jgi:hypothetical protein